MSLHAFVDESKTPGYVVVAVMVPAKDVTAARKSVRDLLLGGQRRIHFKYESMARKLKVLDALGQLDLSVRLYATSRDREARERCFRAMVPDLVAAGVTRLIVERDDSIAALDQRVLYQAIHSAGAAGQFEYHLLRAYEDLLLVAADTVAWCWVRGGRWREAVEPWCAQRRV